MSSDVIDFQHVDKHQLGATLAGIEAAEEDSSSRKSAIMSFLVSSDIGKALVAAAKAHHDKVTKCNPVQGKLDDVESQLALFVDEGDERNAKLLVTKIKAAVDEVNKALANNTHKLKKKDMADAQSKLASLKEVFEKACRVWADWHTREHLMLHWEVICSETGSQQQKEFVEKIQANEALSLLKDHMSAVDWAEHTKLQSHVESVGFLLCWANANWDDNDNVMWHLSASEPALTSQWEVPLDGKNHKYNLMELLGVKPEIGDQIVDRWLIPFEEFKQHEIKENLQEVGKALRPHVCCDASQEGIAAFPDPPPESETTAMFAKLSDIEAKVGTEYREGIQIVSDAFRCLFGVSRLHTSLKQQDQSMQSMKAAQKKDILKQFSSALHKPKRLVHDPEWSLGTLVRCGFLQQPLRQVREGLLCRIG